MKTKATARTKAHIRYKLKDETLVPGATTVLNVLAKPALIYWAWDLGMQKIDFRKHRDKMADIGTLAHLMVLEELSGEKQDYSEYSSDDIDKAENCLLSFYEWMRNNVVKPLMVEKPLVSEKYGYGGTIDCYCTLNGIPTLLDFKTSKAIYDEYFYQLAAYKQLLEESGKPVEQVRILRIGRDEDEGFEDRKASRLEDCWNMFFYCLNIYKTKKILKGK